jgi:hypothetical protein
VVIAVALKEARRLGEAMERQGLGLVGAVNNWPKWNSNC